MDYNYTPEALSKRRGDAAVIYSKLTLLIPRFGKDAVYCFVEGYDMPYYRAIVHAICRREPVEIKCNGKGNVIAANRFIETKEDCRNLIKRYFVDRDFDNNDTLPDTIFVTDGYSIENYYLSDSCISRILQTEFKMSLVDHAENHAKSMDLFHREHNKFYEGTLLLNAWYRCLYQSPDWNRQDVSLGETFPKEWLDLKIENISYNYTLQDIEEKFDKAPKLDKAEVERNMAALKSLGYSRARGKFEMQFLFEFLSFIKNEPSKSRKYSVAPCSLPFQQKTMISTFSQYADVSEGLYHYLETGKC